MTCINAIRQFKGLTSGSPEKTIHWPNADLLLGHRRRRWHNSNSALGLHHAPVVLCVRSTQVSVDHNIDW